MKRKALALRYRLACGCAAFGFAAPLACATDTSLTPVADTYLRANQSTTPFGTVSTIEANNANGVRVMLVRFDLSGITDVITGLHLDLTAVSGSAGNLFQVYGLTAGEGWDESSVSWATAPGVNHSFTGTAGALADYLNPTELSGSGTALASFGSASSGTVNVFNVTSGPVLDFVKADADRVVTFLIAEADPSDTPGDRFNAREATTGRPTLTVTTGTPPPPPPPPPASIKVLRVVLVGGQSNADGRAAGAALPATLASPQANVPFYYYLSGGATNADGTLGSLTTLRPGATQFPSGGFGPEVTLGATLSGVVEQQPGAALAILKFAKGGSNLYSDWKAGGDATTTGDGPQYLIFQRVVHDGLARLRAANPGVTVTLAGMIWVQGESDIDAGSAIASAYGSNLSRFISDVRATFSPTLPFFLSRISAQQTVYSAPSDPDYPNYLTLRDQQAQVTATVPNTYSINTDGAEFTMNSDFLHFNTGGQQALGAAFGTAMSGVLRLRVDTTERAGTGVHIHWNASSGKSYRVQRSSNLADWSPVEVGAVTEWTDPAPGTQRFYRVEEIDDTLQ